MKKSALLSLFIATLFGLIMVSQISIVLAQSASSQPASSPISTPVTPTPTPITGPVTSPSPTATPVPSTYNLSGPVTYTVLGVNVPAARVTVTATNFNTGKLAAITQTSLYGYYNFKLPKGNYKIAVSDSKGTTFNPTSRVLFLDRDRNGIYFRGI